ncbi:MAG: hypothetical protein OEY86_13930 [Nitrospira sp.]|nr:hypothetical protein [Nitrospira sp.]
MAVYIPCLFRSEQIGGLGMECWGACALEQGMLVRGYDGAGREMLLSRIASDQD